MEGKTLIVAKMLTLIVALTGLCALIYGWATGKHGDAPLVLGGIISGLILAILGFSKAEVMPDPQRDSDNVVIKKDDVIKGKEETTHGL